MSLAFAAMLQGFGGLEGFVAAWKDTYDSAPRGTFARFRCLKPVITLLELQASAPKSIPEESFNPAAMNEEQLEDELNVRLRDMIRYEPELAISAAAALGWTIIPPSDSP